MRYPLIICSAAAARAHSDRFSAAALLALEELPQRRSSYHQQRRTSTGNILYGHGVKA